MKLRNKKTGEIVRVEFLNNWQTDDGTEIGFRECSTNNVYSYNSLAELNAEWQDYEEPKEYWTIDWTCTAVTTNKYSGDDIDDFNEAIGNYFSSREEAELAVRKLKAWKRLKDKNFKVDLWDYDGSDAQGRIRTGRILFRVKDYGENDKDLDLLFGGEE